MHEQLQKLSDALSSGALVHVGRMLSSLQPQDVAHLLESSPPRMRHAIWQLVDNEDKGEVFQYLNEDVQSHFLEDMDAGDVLAITGSMDTDDAADILQQLPNTVIQEVLQAMDQQDRLRVERLISYDEDSAGGLMSTEMVAVRAPITLDVVLRYIRRHEELPQAFDQIFVVNRKDQLIGVLPVSKLLVSDLGSTVREIMITDMQSIPVNMPSRAVALLFERNDWVSAPVVDENGFLLGRITIDDIVDVIRDEAEHDMLSMAGLGDEEDTFAPLKRTVPRRSLWLGINLIAAILVSSTIKLFEHTLEQVVALAVLMPIIASMGGVAGNQTLTVVIRGIAVGHINKNNARWLLNREVLTGLLNGLFWALAVGIFASLIYHDFRLALLMAAAIVINLVVAAVFGTLLPLLLKKLHIDPALAGSVLLMTATDVIGFAAFLGLATWFYLP